MMRRVEKMSRRQKVFARIVWRQNVESKKLIQALKEIVEREARHRATQDSRPAPTEEHGHE
jgi:hypothetical protein